MDGKDDALFEHRFWLQILGDHCRFILNALAPSEAKDIDIARRFIRAFDELLARARNAQSDADAAGITEEACPLTEELRNFKLHLLERMLLGGFTFGLSPSFINHMVNELEEYRRILGELEEGNPVPCFGALHHDLLWLTDAAFHAATITGDLDPVEKRLQERGRTFTTHFDDLYLKSIELAGYMRTQLQDFPAFRRFHKDVNVEMNLFRSFLAELESWELTNEVLDSLSPLIPDHMLREECYYLGKLAALGLVPSPNCDPIRPRVGD
ncbi:DUF2935 domain-containing protein [Paenibacillus rhizovicinus]|uniref:DUF2935 domain-containing protein n=1 Tax=Paenibacillus rhizovicinus TaxID=2704463 RepID=A0A6C0P7Z6_9BACL|nr:DUF2935 domain-containing protein [Paenibacillus rhizovicinus]QHW34668.1 DUF2935 domain-containing protein [Paenibacillus rhizovicinus]